MDDTTTPNPHPSPHPAPSGWGAAPAVAPAPEPVPAAAQAPAADPYAAEWDTAQQGPTPWYGAASSTRRTTPRPPWFWPVLAAVVGVAALLAGGGIGYGIGHAVGSGQSRVDPQLPGRGYGFPGGGNQRFPGQSDDGTGSGQGSGSGTGTNQGSGS